MSISIELDLCIRKVSFAEFQQCRYIQENYLFSLLNWRFFVFFSFFVWKYVCSHLLTQKKEVFIFTPTEDLIYTNKPTHKNITPNSILCEGTLYLLTDEPLTWESPEVDRLFWWDAISHGLLPAVLLLLLLSFRACPPGDSWWLLLNRKTESISGYLYLGTQPKRTS